jgi:predicted nucleic acid-binding protein
MATTKPKIYLDSCCFIDVVKRDTGGTLPTDKTADAWYVKAILRAHAAKDLEVYTSLITVGECLSLEKGQPAVPQDVQDRFRSLITSGQYVSLVNPTPKTARSIQDFRWQHGLVLGSPDAIHFASALERGCVEFITTDDRLQKPKVAAAIPKLSSIGIKMIRASATGHLPDAYKQGNLGDA